RCFFIFFSCGGENRDEPPASPPENEHAVAATVDVGLVPESHRALLRATGRSARADGEILGAAGPGCTAQEARCPARLFWPVLVLLAHRPGAIHRIAEGSKKCRGAASAARNGGDQSAVSGDARSPDRSASLREGKAGFARGQDGTG